MTLAGLFVHKKTLSNTNFVQANIGNVYVGRYFLFRMKMSLDISTYVQNKQLL